MHLRMSDKFNFPQRVYTPEFQTHKKQEAGNTWNRFWIFISAKICKEQIPGENKCYAAMTIGNPSVSLHSIPERKVDITMINGYKWSMQNVIDYKLK